MHPVDQYLSSVYLNQNPSWGGEDSPWKAKLVATLLLGHRLSPISICEIGCGAGGCLACLRDVFPLTELFGFDIAPDAAHFWQQHAHHNIYFRVGDFLAINRRSYDIILLLDVIEHLAEPFAFLRQLRGIAKHYVFHIPLDLSAINVLRKDPLLYVRRKVGHIHYFTKDLALSLLEECEFKVVDWRYTGAAVSSPQRKFKTCIAQIPRRLVYLLHKDFGVRMLGGETLLVLATT